MGTTASGRPVAVIGAGAIGLALAAAFARGGREVIVCGGTRFERIEVTEAGAVEQWPVRHAETPGDLAEADTAVLAVKAHHTEAAATWLRALARPEVRLLVAQNGVEHRERVAPYAGPAQIVPAIVYLNVERSAPGRALVRHAGTRDLALPDEDAARDLAPELAAGGLRVELETDLRTVAWAKLLTNITLNPLTALTGRRVDVVRDPGVGEIALQLMLEAAQVARAEGAQLGPDDAHAALTWLENVPAGAPTSMLQDLLAGRPLEYDALTGAVIRAAERHGIEVPVNRMVLALLAAIRPEELHPR